MHILQNANHPALLHFCANGVESLREATNPFSMETTRCVALLDDDYKIIAVCAFDNWTKNGVEGTIATDGTKRWATRRFISTVYQLPFEIAKKERMTAITKTTNEKAIAMHKALGHTNEGLLRDWFGEDQDAFVFGFTRRDWINSRWVGTKGKQQYERFRQSATST